MSEYNYKLISLYVDKNNVLYAIPKGLLPKFDMDAEIDILNILEPPYSDVDVQQIILKTFDQCYTKEREAFDTVGALQKHFGVKAYSAAVRNLKYISVRWAKEEGYSISSSKKVKGSSYDGDGKSKLLGHTLQAGELAVAIREAIEESTTF